MKNPFPEVLSGLHLAGSHRPERLQLLLENSQDVLLETAADGEIIYASGNVKRLFGFEPHELLGTSVFDRIHPEDLPEALVQLPLPECWSTCRCFDKQGRVRWVETTGRDFRLPDGTKHSALIVRDITGHRQAEISLLEHKRALATVLSNLPGMVYRRKTTSRWVLDFVSDGCDDLTGYKPHDFLQGGIDYGALIVEEDRPATAAAILEALRTRGRFQLQYRIRTASGEIKWVCERGLGIFAGEEGELLNIEGFIADISELKRTEQALRESEEKFSKAFRASPGAISISDARAQTFVAVNDGFVKMFGYNREELLGKTSADPKLWESDADRSRYWQQFFAQGFLRNIEMAGRAKNGDRIICLLSAESVQLNGQQCVVATLHDITGLRRAQEERASLEAQLREAQKLEAIGALAGGIAHDFNNILAAILAYLELADMEPNLPENIRSYLAEIKVGGDRAKRLVQQILTFSRRQSQERTPVRLQPVIKEALELMRSTLPSTIEIETDIDERAPAVMANSTQIHQVLMNLCTNAAYAMRGKPGRLSVTLKRVLANKAQPEADDRSPRCEKLQLSIRDTGHGMDESTLGRVFEPFFTTKPPGEGTGLGLSVVHGIVRDHHGAITVSSQPGQGSIFDVCLPVLGGSTEVAEKAPEAPLRGCGERILLIEDEPAVSDSMQRILARLGYQVTTHPDPLAALEDLRLQHANYDLLITDLTMPRMTGLELALHARKLRATLPVILMTGFTGEVSLQQINALGLHGLLIKPVTIPSLAEKIHNVLAQNKGCNSND